MLKPRIIPVLLLQNQGLVKTIRFGQPRYVGDPINTARILYTKKADEIILLDIDATRQHRPPDFDLITRIADQCFIPFTYGGGITTLDQIHHLIRHGCEKVVLNSSLVSHPELLAQAAAKFGSQSLVASIDYRDNQVYINSGQTPTSLNPISHALNCVQNGCGEILLNSIDRDGTLTGYDLPPISQLSAICSVPVIACGGVASQTDLSQAIKHGASAAAAGSLFFFYGRRQAVLISYPTQAEKEKICQNALALAVS